LYEPTDGVEESESDQARGGDLSDKEFGEVPEEVEEPEPDA